MIVYLIIALPIVERQRKQNAVASKQLNLLKLLHFFSLAACKTHLLAFCLKQTCTASRAAAAAAGRRISQLKMPHRCKTHMCSLTDVHELTAKGWSLNRRMPLTRSMPSSLNMACFSCFTVFGAELQPRQFHSHVLHSPWGFLLCKQLGVTSYKCVCACVCVSEKSVCV